MVGCWRRAQECARRVLCPVEGRALHRPRAPAPHPVLRVSLMSDALPRGPLCWPVWPGPRDWRSRPAARSGAPDAPRRDRPDLDLAMRIGEEPDGWRPWVANRLPQVGILSSWIAAKVDSGEELDA